MSTSPSAHPIERLDPPQRTLRRAQYEAFEFELVAQGVLVRNASHATPEDHEYLVTIEDGLPHSCPCPADEHHQGACKHRVAVAIRTPVLEAARNAQRIRELQTSKMQATANPLTP
ncbi:SWIM zinc finger family protein [Natrialba taiwanensis]|uniref:Zinc finger SWIM domain protein n=1 Tax=Natrialba taiwanensis DSM 12281 TaxID=1230458 RepID=M0A227_9EURY|nr:SWIM zinc finger family protein [Natrialba taiwanensis]ELY91408.1 zinc finger SWIM domain protein [Natrialba taiwanensis DSM 12281]